SLVMDPYILETYQKRILKRFYSLVARCLIVASFVADGVKCIKYCRFKGIELNLTWNCGLFVAGLYHLLLAMVQLLASILVVAQKEKLLATGMLWLAAHIRLATNPLLWSVPMYLEVLGTTSALLLTMLKPRHQVVITFLLITLLNCHHSEHLLWDLFNKFIMKELVVFFMVGYRVKLNASLLILLMAAQCWHVHAFWRVPIALGVMDIRELKVFHFWNKVTVIGGLFL
ncbi:hypothetical protein KR074_004066, partial [Drosophila pseudoananassae]